MTSGSSQGARIALVVLGAGLCASAFQAPRAVFVRDRFHFGVVNRGGVVEHEFVVENRGSAPLRILKTSMTPPLLATSLPARIAPGAQAALRFRLDTNELEGLFDGVIAVFLNDPVLPVAYLVFKGQVISTVEILPSPSVAVSALRGKSARASVEIVNHEAQPLRIVKVEHPTERFTTTLETVQPGRRYRLTVFLNPDGPSGDATQAILLRTTSSTAPVLRITANTLLHERTHASPNRVQLGSLPLAAIRQNPEVLRRFRPTVTVYSVGRSDLQVSARSDLPFLDLRVERGPRGDRCRLILHLIPERLRPGRIQGSIVIQTNDPEFPSLTVPVSGIVVER